MNIKLIYKIYYKAFKIAEEELLASYKNVTVDSVTYQKPGKQICLLLLFCQYLTFELIAN